MFTRGAKKRRSGRSLVLKCSASASVIIPTECFMLSLVLQRRRIRTRDSRVCAVENSVLASACMDGVGVTYHNGFREIEKYEGKAMAMQRQSSLIHFMKDYKGDACVLKELGRVLVLHRRTVMPYAAYARKRKGSNDEKEVEQYASLLGQTCAERILLYRA
ncbi:hypothetical protein cypCar_00030597 [Cyprinus carpio]|nr:hypothetical protein cypCar_00030597 [Cyprinus carpio]